MSFRFARLALPLIALAVIAGTACTPVKQQLGKNILAYSITNGCLPGLPFNQPANGFRSPEPNFSREVCGNGLALHALTPGGVKLQVIHAVPASTSGANPLAYQSSASVSFVIGGLPLLGEINGIEIGVSGSHPVGVALVLDKNGDGKFLGEPGATTPGFNGDAIAAFDVKTSSANPVLLLDNTRTLTVLQEPCPGFPTPCGPPTNHTLANLKAGEKAGIDGNTRLVISVSMALNAAVPGPAEIDGAATVNSFKLNGIEMLP